MKDSIWKYIVAITLLAMVRPIQFMAYGQLAPAMKQTQYVVQDLGTLGGTAGVAEGISDRGWVVGSANLPGDQNGHAFLWRGGVMTDLGTLGGLNSQEQWPVNDDRGLIAGVAETSGTDPLGEDFCHFGTGLICLGFLWQNGVMTPLPTLGGNNGQALGVNNYGQVVGYAENSTQDPTCIPPQVLDIEAVIWEPKKGEIHQLFPLPGDTEAGAIGINDNGQAVGVSGVCSNGSLPIHAVLWQKDGKVKDLGNLGGVLNSFPWAVNSRGQVVGQSNLSGDTTVHAFLWTDDDGMQDLGTLSGDFASLSFGINDKGYVVGGSCIDASFNSCRAFLWQDAVMTDLNTLVKPGSTPLYLFFGNDINSRGEVVGYAFDQTNGEFRAFLATPCDEKHADNEGCKDGAEGTTAVRGDTSERPKVALPENVRKQLQQRRGFGRFASGLTRPQ
jgi:probable HAF family extracellular repeat protein